jgi:hypothetical protein
MSDPTLYAIYDLQNNKYVGRNNKFTWTTPGAAKNAAILIIKEKHKNFKIDSFKRQSFFVIHEVSLYFRNSI